MRTAILLAAGSGSRMGDGIPDKILAPLGDRPVLAHSVDAFCQSGTIDGFTLVFRDDAQRAQLADCLRAATGADPAEVRWVRGGGTRAESVANALAALPDGTERVFIHDCARPLIHPEALRRLAQTAGEDGAAVLAYPVTDTVKRLPAPDALCRTTLEDLRRDRLWAMETPQAFAFPAIRDAYARARADGITPTDDTAAAQHAGLTVTVVPNPYPNPKLTRPEDFTYAESLLQY